MDNDLPELEEHVPRKLKFNLSLGGFANGLLSALPFANLSYYYQIKLGLDGTLIGIAWMIFLIWNTANDPLFSYLIDNTRTKFGRRIPFIRYGSPFYGLSFILCWIPFASASNQIGLFFNLLVNLFFLDTMFTIVGCCFFALPNEIAVTAKQRASLTLYSSAFMFLTLILGIGLPILLLTGSSGVSPLFEPIMIVIGISCSIILFVTSFGIKENIFAQDQEKQGFWEGLKETTKNKPFWIVMIPAFCLSLIMPLIQTGVLYYIDFVVVDQDITWFLLAFVTMIVVGLVAFIKLLERWKVKKTSQFTFYLFTVAFILTFLLGFNAYGAILPFGIFGFAFAGGMICNSVLMGDCIDNDELITGMRREAIYGGVNAIVTKPGVSVANWGFLGIIGLFGFDKDATTQEPLAIIGIMVALCLMPAVGTLISAIALKWYPLDGIEWSKKKKFILEMHGRKEKEWLEKNRDTLRDKPTFRKKPSKPQ
ncbi:MAG: MFS transporter [Promethearchaeota archaeon]